MINEAIKMAMATKHVKPPIVAPAFNGRETRKTVIDGAFVSVYDTDAFLQGVNDCKAGVAHKDRGPEYERGYAAQYQREAMEGVL
jgi:predicted RNA-binding Zn ribbon-like protein